MPYIAAAIKLNQRVTADRRSGAQRAVIASHYAARALRQAGKHLLRMAHRGGKIHDAARSVTRLVDNIGNNGSSLAAMAYKCALYRVRVQCPVWKQRNAACVISFGVDRADHHRRDKALVQHFACAHAVDTFHKIRVARFVLAVNPCVALRVIRPYAVDITAAQPKRRS